MTIFIGNLSWDSEVEDLKDLFNIYGKFKKCTIPLYKYSWRKRGFGFVEMINTNTENNAIDDL